ncbi:hypothetical protein AOLI_G00280300 [Acnodon oligacanthus]
MSCSSQLEQKVSCSSQLEQEVSCSSQLGQEVSCSSQLGQEVSCSSQLGQEVSCSSQLGQVINAYIFKLVRKHNQEDEDKAYMIDSFTMTKLWQGSYKILRKAIYPSQKRAVFLDPLGESHTKVNKRLETTRAFMRNKGCRVSRWTCDSIPPPPVQRDVTSCGVFVCKFAEKILQDQPITFLNTDMAVNLIRKEMAMTLLQESDCLRWMWQMVPPVMCWEPTSRRLLLLSMCSKAIYPSQKRAVFLDPFGESHTKVNKRLETTRAFMRNKGCRVLRWTCDSIPPPVQRDVTSCGVFVCKFAEKILQDQPITFLNTDMAVNLMWKEMAMTLLQESAKPSSSATSPPCCTSQQAQSADRSAAAFQTDAVHLVQVVQLSSSTVQQSDESSEIFRGHSADPIC